MGKHTLMKVFLIMSLSVLILPCIVLQLYAIEDQGDRGAKPQFSKNIEVDLNGDGSTKTIEISSDGYWGTLKILSKKDGKLAQIWQSPDRMVGSFGDLQCLDINNDGKKEIAVTWTSMRYQNMWVFVWDKKKNIATAISPRGTTDGLSLFIGESVEIQDDEAGRGKTIYISNQIERGQGVDISKAKRAYFTYKWNGNKYYLAETQYDYSGEEVTKYQAIAAKYTPTGFKQLSVDKIVRNGKEFTVVEYFGPVTPPKLYAGGFIVFENNKGNLKMLARTTELMKGSLGPAMYLSGINKEGNRIIITERQFNADIYIWAHLLSKDKSGNSKLTSVTPAGENQYVSGIKGNLRAGFFSIKDINGDGIMEIIVNDFNDKNEKVIKYYKWDGKQYVYGGLLTNI